MDFFNVYPRQLNLPDVKHNAYSAPLNIYSKDWDKISYDYRASINWKCEKCNMNYQGDKSLLHTHHINGLKNDNAIDNLEALCVKCHAKQPYHGHMKAKRVKKK